MHKATLSVVAKSVEELKSSLEEKFGDKILSIEVRSRVAGKQDETSFYDVWISCSKGDLVELVEFLFSFDFPIFHVMSGDDIGNAVLLNYHFSLFIGAGRGKRIGVVLSLEVPKEDLTMPSLYDKIPSIEYSEREMHEMLGVSFNGLPNQSLVFLPEDWDEKVHPWRRDDSGLSPKHIKELS